MSEGHTVTITPSDAHLEVTLGGELLASSDNALRLEETGLPARYYLPKADVRMDLLEATTFHTTCPFKGEASYWSATIDGTRHEMRAGDRRFSPRGLVHAFSNPGDVPTRVLLVFSPAKIGPAYFREVADLLAAGGPPDLPKMRAVMEKHGLTLAI